MTKATRFCVCLQRGGVGKTTVTTQFADELARQGKKVLIVDLDPQGNSTSFAGRSRNIYEFEGNTAMEVITGELPVKACIFHHDDHPNIDFIPAGDSLAWFSKWLYTVHKNPNGIMVLDDRLTEIENDYHYIMIDTGPALGDLMASALCSSHYIVVPTTCGEWSLQAVNHFVETVGATRQIAASFGRDRSKLIGILRNMFQTNQLLENYYSDQLAAMYPDDILETIIPSRARVKDLALELTNLDRADHRDAVKKFQEAIEEVLDRVWKAEHR